jgi:hypothetical protein
MDQKQHSITIPYKRLSPPLREIIGQPFSGTPLDVAGRIFGIDRGTYRINRFWFRKNIPEMQEHLQNDPILGPADIRGSRLSRITSEINLFFKLTSLSQLTPNQMPTAFWKVLNRIEAARLVQFFHEKLSKEMLRSKMVVAPAFMDNYSAEEKNAELLAKTHPIFRVNFDGSMTFLPVSRVEYARYVFQQKRLGKLGVQPWHWRGYLGEIKAPEPWKKWARQRVRMWVGKINEKWVPEPMPKPAMVRVHAAFSPWKKMVRRVSRRSN